MARSLITDPAGTTATSADGARALAYRTAVSAFVAVVLALGVRSIAVTVDPGLAAISPLGSGPVVGSVIIAATGAAVVYAGTVRYTARATRTFLIAAGLVFALSLVPIVIVPAGAGVTTAAQPWLVALHVAVAVPLTLTLAVPGLIRTDAR